MYTSFGIACTVGVCLLIWNGCIQDTDNHYLHVSSCDELVADDGQSVLLNVLHTQTHDDTRNMTADSTISDSAVMYSAAYPKIKGALLATRFADMEALQRIVSITYVQNVSGSMAWGTDRPAVVLTHCSAGRKVSSVLTTGVNEEDFKEALDGNLFDKIYLGLSSPYTAVNRKKLLRVSILARRRHDLFGWRDVAFFDLAESMVEHIHADDLKKIEPADLGEKGYLNTFNHVNAEAIMTSLFSENIADFIADAHERHHMPELIEGRFTPEQLSDPNNNPMDNYVDIINNEWGQEIGKELKEKYGIEQNTLWTTSMLVEYLNDLQSYFSWAFQIRFEPFTEKDYVVERFTRKLNETRDF